jgi:hypothetical protein
MNESDRDQLLLAQGYALREMQRRMDMMQHQMHILQERLLILDAALMIEEVEDGISPNKMN